VSDRRELVRDRIAAVASGVRFGKFVSVGAVGAVFDTMTLVVLTEFGGLPAAVANLISIEVAILVMFAINDTWTFADEGAGDTRSLGRRLLRSHLVRAGGSSVQYALFVLVFYGVSVDLSYAGIDLWLIVVKGGAIACAMFINFFFESIFTWRVHQDDEA
jgi:putative flippase GtrA